MFSQLSQTALAVTLISVVPAAPKAFAQRNASAAAELAEMDAAATMLGSIRSWVNGEPEAAIQAFREYKNIRRYVDSKYGQYAGATANGTQTATDRQSLDRSGDRVKQIASGIKAWEEFVPSYREKQPQQIATELKRQRDAVERYRKSKSPRPGSFAYIPKTVWQTKDKLDVLTASGVDTAELQKEQKEVQSMVLDLLNELETEVIASKNGYVRDAYKANDRASIEDFVRSEWHNSHPTQTIERIVMPKQSWSNTYSARTDSKSGRVVPFEVDRITVYVATKKFDSVFTLNPVRLMRENYRVNGQRIGRVGRVGPQMPQQIATNEFPFDVLAKNIR